MDRGQGVRQGVRGLDKGPGWLRQRVRGSEKEGGSDRDHFIYLFAIFVF